MSRFILKNKAMVCIVLMMGLFANTAVAKMVQNLYTARVKVNSEDKLQRQQAIEQALGDVVLKLTAKPIDSYPKLQQKLGQSQNWVESFNYTKSREQLSLNVVFDEMAIKQVLQQLQITMWDKQRPRLLLWLLIDDNQTQRILDDENLGDVGTNVVKAFQDFGIPIVLPLMDIDELSNVTEQDIMQHHLEKLNAAVGRYAANGMIVGHLRINDANISLSWELVLDGESFDVQISSQDINAALQQTLSQMSQNLVQRYAIEPEESSAQQVYLSVHQIKSVKTYNLILSYLQRLPMVNEVDVESVSPNDVTYKLELRGSVAKLTQALELDKRFSAMRSDSTSADLLSYRWTP